MAMSLNTSRRHNRQFPGKCGKRPDLYRDRQIAALRRHLDSLKASPDHKELNKTVSCALVKLQISKEDFILQYHTIY